MHTQKETNSDDRTFGQKIADKIAEVVGSWRFVITQSIILVAWIFLNSTGYLTVDGMPVTWDKPPFILLNLLLSFQAAYTAPIIMMSQNRQETRDRQRMDDDYKVNLMAKDEIEAIQLQLNHMQKHLEKHIDLKGEIGSIQKELQIVRDNLSPRE